MAAVIVSIHDKINKLTNDISEIDRICELYKKEKEILENKINSLGDKRDEYAEALEELQDELPILQKISAKFGISLQETERWIINEQSFIKSVGQVVSHSGELHYIPLSDEKKTKRNHWLGVAYNYFLDSDYTILITEFGSSLYFFYFNTVYRYDIDKCGKEIGNCVVRNFRLKLSKTVVRCIYQKYYSFSWRNSIHNYKQLIESTFPDLRNKLDEKSAGPAEYHDLVFNAVRRRHYTEMYSDFIVAWCVGRERINNTALERCPANKLFEPRLLWKIVEYLL
jgi:flagellar biosynthesis chaperone FliJ